MIKFLIQLIRFKFSVIRKKKKNYFLLSPILEINNDLVELKLPRFLTILSDITGWDE